MISLVLQILTCSLSFARDFSKVEIKTVKLTESLYVLFGPGGSVAGVIKAVETVLRKTSKDTRIIPGHGPLSDGAELMAYHAMLKTIRDQVRTLKQGGATLAEVIAAKPTAAFDEKLGGGLIKPDKFAEIVCQSLK